MSIVNIDVINVMTVSLQCYHLSTFCLFVCLDAVFVPVVCVVLEGGPNTVETVRSAIVNNTPAIIVEVCESDVCVATPSYFENF